MNHPPLPPPPAQEYSTAQEAFAKREYSHAVFHLSYALMSKPLDADYLALLNRIINNAREPLQLVQKDANGGMHYAHAAANAYIHAQLGKYEEAVSILNQVVKAANATQYLPWAGDWLSNPERAAQLTPNTVMMLLFAITSSQGESIADPKLREAVNKILPTLARLREDHPQEGLFASVTGIILRKMGRYDESIAVGKSAYAATPDYMPAAFLAGTYKDKGDIPAAVEMFKKALSHKPEDVYVRLDLGDMLCKDGQYEAGLDYYQQALNIEPENAWAKPHFLYYQAVFTKEPHWTDDLRAYAESHPENRQAADLLWALTKLPYVDYLPQPEEATIGAVRHMAAQKVLPQSFGVSSLEAPSARLALDLYVQENGGTQKTPIGVAEVQTPDPSVPFDEVRFVLWKYDGTDPYPNVEPPNPQIAEAVAKVAARPYNLEAWQASARKLGSAATPSRLDSLLGVMVHPPPHPAEIPIWDWIQRVQVVAALSIAYIDEGWQNSERREALISLARGPMDWTVGAAILALTQVALEDPVAEQEITNLFGFILHNAPRQGHVSHLRSLVVNTLRLPHLAPEIHQQVERIRRDLDY